jgi:predicted Rossmann fold nucleotide-binding protein DprA/Smf involved in DNA uptake
MSDKEDAKKRTQVLKRLREEHKDTVERTRELLKEQRAIRRQIYQAMGDAPRTVPMVAEATGLPADLVLWHITAMKKYDLMAEVGMCDEYYQYQRTPGAKI